MSLSKDASATSDGGDFASFLSSVPTTLAERTEGNDGSSIDVVMGNEAGDADSIVAALGLGYVKSRQHGGAVAVPVVSVPRADVGLRRDVVLLLDLAGIPLDGLLCLDDDVAQRLLPPTSDDTAQSSPSTSLTLVDHNRIRSSLSHLSSRVAEIVDHHEDEGSHGSVTGASREIAFEDGKATVASACTLVAERAFEQQQLPAGEDSDATTRTIDGSLGLALLGVILLDAVNMLPAAGKGTPRDERAMQTLLRRTDWTSFAARTAPSLLDAPSLEKIYPRGRGSAPDRAALFEALHGAKNDPKFWASLSAWDCLRIDYKKFLVPDHGNPRLVPSIGLSSVLIDMDSLLSKKDFLSEMESYVKACDVGLFGVLALDFRDGAPRRELLLAGSDTKVVDAFSTFLLDHPETAFLQIAEREGCAAAAGEDAGATVRVFEQGNGKGSRKQVAPVLLGHAANGS